MLKYGPYSPSRLDTAVCGFAFFKQYVDPERKKAQKVENVPQARGSAVHEIFEQVTKKFTKNLGEPIVYSDLELRRLVAEAINRHPAAYNEVDEIITMTKKYIATPPPVLTSDADVELRLAVKLEGSKFVECDYDDPAAWGRGRADIMMISDDTTSALVYDHKTQPNMEEADTFQLGFYAWVISKIHPYLEQIQTVLHFARYGKYSDPFVWTREQLEQVEDGILTRISAIESRQEWVAVPNDKCQYCPFIADCPVMSKHITKTDNGSWIWNAKGLKVEGDTNKAVEVAGFITVAEEALSFARKELKSHVKKSESPVAIDGRIFGFKEDEAIDWARVNKYGELKDAVCDVFRKHNIDPLRFMGFSQSVSSAIWLLTEDQQLLQDLSAVLPRKKSTEFGGHKA